MSRSMYSITSRTKNTQVKYTNQLARELSPNLVTGNIPFLSGGSSSGGGGGPTTNVDLTAVTTNIVPTTNGSQNLGDGSHRFGTTYTNNLDIAGSVSGQIVPVTTNGSQNIGSLSNRFGSMYSNNININGDVIPANTGASNLGTSSKVFGNLHINEIVVRGNILPPEQNYPARQEKLGPGGVILETARPEVSSAIQVNIGGPDHYYGSLYAKEIFTSGNTITLGGAELKSDGETLTMPVGSKIGGVDPGTIVIKGNRANINLLPNATGGSTNTVGDGYVIDGNLWVASVTNSTLANGWVSVGSFRGPKGDQGDQGIQGNAGLQGIQGIQGIQGLKGDTGSTGPQGPPGVLDTTGATFSGTITMPDLIVTGNSGFGKSNPAYRVDVSGSLNASSLYQNGTLISSIYATTSSLGNYYTKTSMDLSINGSFYNKTYINNNFYNRTDIDTNLSTNFYNRTAIDNNLSTNFYNRTTIDASLNDNFYNRTAIDNNLSTNFYNKSGIDSSLNTNFYNKRSIDASINTNIYNKTTIDASINTNIYNKTTIDASINTNIYNKTTIDASINTNIYNKRTIDLSLNANFYNKSGIDASLNTNFYNKGSIDSILSSNYYIRSVIDSSINTALNSYYTKTDSDANISTTLGSYYTKVATDSSINSVLNNFARTSTLDSYYTKVATDSSINSTLSNYAKTSYVDNVFTTYTNVSPTTLNTLNQIAAAVQGDASFVMVVSGRLNTADASINAIRADIQTLNGLSTIQDPSINELVTYNLAQDATIASLPTKAIVDASLSQYYTKVATDSSINTLINKYYTKVATDSSINALIGSYYTKVATDSSINAVLGSYALASSLDSYYTKIDTDLSINAVLADYTKSSALNSYYTKIDTDSSINTVLGSYALSSTLDAYYTKTASDSSINSILASYARSSALNSYYTKTATDSSINSVLNNFARTSSITANYYNKAATETLVNTALGSYATTGYVDTQITNFTNVSPTTLNTLNQIAASVQGDASFVMVVSGRLNSSDASINAIRAQIEGVSAAQDPSINELITYNTTQDGLISSMLVKADFDSSMNTNYYSRAAVDSSLSTGFYNRATTDLSLSRYLLKSAFDSSLNNNYYSRAAVDSSLNAGFYNKSTVDVSLGRYLLKTAFDSSLNANYYSKRTIDNSLNANFYNKSMVDSNLGVINTNLSTNYYIRSDIDASINSALDSYYTKTDTDASINSTLDSYYTKTTTDSSINSVLSGYARSSTLNSYYTRVAADSSVNAALASYAKTSYVDNVFTTYTNVSPTTLNTLNQIAAAVQGDASFVMVVSGRLNSSDASINAIRADIQTLSGLNAVQDPSINELITYNLAQDSTISALPTKSIIDASLSRYYTKTATDSSINTLINRYYTKIASDSSINSLIQNYYTKVATDSSINAILGSYALSSTLNDGYYTKVDTDSSINAVLGSYTLSSTLNDGYYTKVDTDSSINSVLSNYTRTSALTASYYTKSATDSSINSVLSNYARSSTLNSYYTKSATDSSINTVLGRYSTITYVDTQITNFTNVSPTTLNTLNQIAAAVQGDASFVTVVSGRLNSSDASINAIRAQIEGVSAAQDPSINQLISYNSSQDVLINSMLVKADFDSSMNANYYSRVAVDSSLNAGFYNRATTDLSMSRYLLKSAFDSSLNNNYYSRAAVDSSLNTGFYNKSTVDVSLGRYLLKTAFDSSLNANYYSRPAIDLSLNNNFYNKSTINTTLGTYLLKTDFDASLNANYYDKASVNAGFYDKTTIDGSLNTYFYDKTTIDGSLNTNFFNKTAINTTLNSYLLKTTFDNSMNANYYNKSRIDSSINSIISNYSTINYVDGRFTTLTGVAPSQLDTLAEIATALQGDASFGMTVYAKITSTDASVNTIRNNLSNTDSSVNTIRTNFNSYVTANDSSVNTIRTNFNSYVTANDSSVNTIRTNFNSYVTANDASLGVIRTSIQQLSITGAIQDPSINQLIAYNTIQDSSINTIQSSLSNYATTSSLGNYTLKSAVDASLALYSTKSIIDASLSNYALTSSLSSYATNASLSSYTLKSAVDASLALYSTTTYVDNRFTTLTGVAPSQLDTLAEISTALQGDASFGMTVYAKITSTDSSVNTIRTSLANTDSSVNTIRTSLASTDSSVNTIRTSLAATDSSINNIRTNVQQVSNTDINILQANLANNLNAVSFVSGNANVVNDTVGTGSWKFYVAGNTSTAAITSSSASTEWSNGNLLSYYSGSPNILDYQFETANQTGSTIKNLATDDYTMTLYNGASIATASPAPYSPGYLSMNISSGQYASATVPFSLSPPWTISFWYRTSGTYPTGGSSPTIFEIGNGTNALRIEGTNSWKTIMTYTNGTYVSGYYISDTNDTSWTHYVLAYNSGYTSYKNGVSVQNGFPNLNVTTNYTYMNFGKSNVSSLTNPTGGSYVINIDKFQIFNFEFSASQAQSLYNNTFTTPVGNPTLKDVASGVIWKTIPASVFNSSETSYTVKSNEIALTPGTNSTYAVWTAPKTSNIRIDASFADYHSRSVGVGFQIFKINANNTFGSVLFSRTVTTAALTNAAPNNYLSIPSTTVSVNTGDMIYYRIDANGNTTAASSVLATSIFTDTSVKESLNTTRTSLASYVLSNDASLGAIRTSIQQLSITGAIQDPSINQIILYNSNQDSSINTIRSSLSNYTLKSAVDASLALYSTKSIIDASLALYSTKSIIDASLALYSTKSIIDASLSNYALTSSLSIYATNASLSSYTLKSDVDASLALYSTTTYVDGRFTTLTGVAPSQLDTLAEIATALQGDASFGINVYQRLSDVDSSINTIRTSLSNYTLKSTVDSSLALYSTKSIIDASLALYSTRSIIDASLALYSTRSIIDASLANYVLTSSLGSLLQSGSSSDVSLNGNIQLGNGTKNIQINKTAISSYSLDVSGSVYVSNNLDMSGSINATGIFNNGDVFDSASDGLSTDTYGNLTATETVVYPFSGTFNQIATSSDGKYITAVSYGGSAVFSSNYGATFTDISNSVLGINKLQPFMSSTGQYQYLPATGGNCYLTNNYGTSWVIDTSASPAIAVSTSGKYVLKLPATGTNVSISSNFGVSSTTVNVGTGLNNLYTCAMSETGQVMAIGPNSGTGMKISQNFGKTWFGFDTSSTAFTISISASGRYILSGSNLSNDFGNTFFRLPSPANIANVCGSTMSSNGQYMAISSTNTGFYSIDYGRTWTQRNNNGTNSVSGSNMAMVSNGGIIYQATTTGVLRLSASQTSIVSDSMYVVNNIDMSGSINTRGIFYNGDVFDSASDGLSTHIYSSFLNVETQITVPNIAQCQQVMTSGDGKYITLVSYTNGVAISNNYGSTFTDISNVVGNVNKWGAVMSDTGQYQYLSANGACWKTTNYGNTWVTDNQSALSTGVSGSGRYVIKNSNGFSINISSNFGETYTGLTLSATNVGLGLAGIAISKTGQIMMISSNAFMGKISNNFGRTWRDLPFVTNAIAKIAMSASGKYILAGNALSNNFGVSFEALPAPANIANNGVTGLNMSPNGQYMFISNSSTAVYSRDYGKTWVSRATNGSTANSAGNGTGCVAMPSNASYVLIGTTNGLFKYNSFTETDVSINTDVTFSGNVQIGTTRTQFLGINKAPNPLYSLDISGDLDVNGNSYFGTGTNFTGINKQSPVVALDISGSTNMSGNLTLVNSPSVPMGLFDISAVNMSVFNVAEKFTTVALSATPTLDYRTGGIFYMAAVNAALTTISITNVPTTLNRSISVTLILAQTGGAGTNCFTTGTLNVNGTSITYLKPDATALAAPSANRAVIINQFIIIWVSSTPTVIAYLSSMG